MHKLLLLMVLLLATATKTFAVLPADTVFYDHYPFIRFIDSRDDASLVRLSDEVFLEEAGKLVQGGPMMGVAQYTLDAPVAKGTSALLAFNEKDARPVTPTACIRCGGCIDHCPMNLMPMEFERAFENKDAELLKKLKINLCMECGCCAFQCPAHRPLVQVNKLAKSLVREYDARQKEAAK